MKAQSRNFLVENIYILSAFAVRHNLVRFDQRLSLTTLLACAVSRGFNMWWVLRTFVAQQKIEFCRIHNRFPCCSKCFACDVCHDESEDHEMKFATRMVCGFCSKEQVKNLATQLNN